MGRLKEELLCNRHDTSKMSVKTVRTPAILVKHDSVTAEYELLLYLMQNKGKTVTWKKILEQVWDVNGNYVNNNTLTVTMKRLWDKLYQPS